MKPRKLITARRVGRLTRGERAKSDARGQVEELGAARRQEVYRTDVDFAPEGECSYEPDKRWGSSERWVAQIRELYGRRGMTQLAVSCELGITQSYVGTIARRYGIGKGQVKDGK